MRGATRFIAVAIVMTLVVGLGACNDLRDFRGSWRGPRVGETPAVRQGIGDTAEATLVISAVDTRGLHGTLAIDSLIAETELVAVEGAEADKVAGMTFTGGPIRVYLAFAATSDAGGDALVMVALYDDQRIEVRLMRGGTKPLYGIFELAAS